MPVHHVHRKLLALPQFALIGGQSDSTVLNDELCIPAMEHLVAIGLLPCVLGQQTCQGHGIQHGDDGPSELKGRIVQLTDASEGLIQKDLAFGTRHIAGKAVKKSPVVEAVNVVIRPGK